ncbi:uncharacterized protein LOC144301572 [Canis aureus]
MNPLCLCESGKHHGETRRARGRGGGGGGPRSPDLDQIPARGARRRDLGARPPPARRPPRPQAWPRGRPPGPSPHPPRPRALGSALPRGLGPRWVRTVALSGAPAPCGRAPKPKERFVPDTEFGIEELLARPGRPRDRAREALVPATPDAAETPTGEDSLDRGLRWTQGRRSSGGAEAKNRFQETETSSGGCAASSSSAFTPALCPRSFSSLPVSRVQGFLSRQQLQGCCDARLGRIGLAHVTFLPPLSPQCQTHCSLDPFHVREGPGAIALDQEVGRPSRLRTKVKIGMGRKRKRRHRVLLIAREASLVSLAPMQPLTWISQLLTSSKPGPILHSGARRASKGRADWPLHPVHCRRVRWQC